MSAVVEQNSLPSMFIKGLAVFVLSVVFLIVTRVISDISFNLAAEIYPEWIQLDPDGAFLYITLHHLFQAVIAFACVVLLARVLGVSLGDFGFNTHQWRYAVRRVLQFCGIWFILQGSIALLMMLSGTEPVPFSFPLTVGNFGSHFLFQVLLSGSSEEILYRSLIIAPLWIIALRLGYSEKMSIVIAVLVSTLCFMFGHVNFELNPFRITYINWLQQATVVIFGLFYAFLFVKTRSLIGPILAHNMLNGVIVLISLLVILLFG